MIPAGLQSLMGGNKPSVPQDLNALLSAQRVLKEQANPTTPDGRPTIAAQTEQAIAAQTGQDLNQGMQQQPSGMPGMLPSDPFKEQLMKTLQMQAQQQMAQMGPQPPQEMAEGGIASLPAENMEDLEYAQGGVIGFFDGGVSPEFGAESLAASLADANTVSNSDLSKAIAEETARLDFLKRSNTREDLIKASQERLEALKSGKTPDTTPNESAAESARLSRQQAKETPRATGATRQMQAGSAPAGGGGIDSLMKKLMSDYESDRKSLQSIRGQGVGMAVPTQEALLKLREDFRKQQGLTGLAGSAIEDVMREQAARDEELRAEYEAGKGRRVPENWMTALAARARGQAGSFGEAVAKQDQQQRKEDLEFRRLMMASAAKRDEMKVAVQNMREAVADGNFKELRKEQENYRDAKLARDKIDADISQSLTTGSRQMLSEERQRRENAASRALQREDMLQRSRENLLANINRDIGIKMTELKHKLEKEHPGAMILKLAEMGGASPEDVEKARQIRAEIDYTVAKQVAPLEQQRRQVMSQLGYLDMNQWGKMSVK